MCPSYFCRSSFASPPFPHYPGPMVPVLLLFSPRGSGLVIWPRVPVPLNLSPYRWCPFSAHVPSGRRLPGACSWVEPVSSFYKWSTCQCLIPPASLTLCAEPNWIGRSFTCRPQPPSDKGPSLLPSDCNYPDPFPLLEQARGFGTKAATAHI